MGAFGVEGAVSGRKECGLQRPFLHNGGHESDSWELAAGYVMSLISFEWLPF